MSPPPDDDALLDELQRGAFAWLREQVNPANGLVADTDREGAPCSIAVVGFALAGWAIGAERGWMPRAEALGLCLTALRFFRDSDQSGTPQATGHQGFYYHFLDRETGARVWASELSMIDTALLLVGALAAGRYFDDVELQALVDQLYQRVDWRWALGDAPTIRLGWKPECGFLNYGWEGYSEAAVLYALALGSPTAPIAPESYRAWTATYQWEHLYGHDVLYAGPLFVHQFSHVWIDFRGIRDRFMREVGSDYFENSRRATLIQSAYTLRNPHDFEGYGEHCWGLTACDGPSDEDPAVDNEARRLFGYAARGVPYGPDDGTLSPAGVVASVPFAPALALQTLREILARYPDCCVDGRLSSFNPSFTAPDGRLWISARYGLDQGLVVTMIENHRTGLLWDLLRDCPPLAEGLRRAGFRGGGS